MDGERYAYHPGPCEYAREVEGEEGETVEAKGVAEVFAGEGCEIRERGGRG